MAGVSADNIWVSLDAGADKGLRVGMELWLVEPTNNVISVRIAGVQDKQSEGIISRVVRDEPEPLPGWRVSTRAPWNDLPKDKSTGRKESD
jgi:hypothetical protein